jgi:hypothetical protein
MRVLLLLLTAALRFVVARGSGSTLLRHSAHDTMQRADFGAGSDEQEASSYRYAQECPPPLDSSLCIQPLNSVEKWQKCADACIQASCCQGVCATQCSSCISYAPCLQLGEIPPEAGGNSTTGTDMTCNESQSYAYYQGINLNFVISESEAKALMPSRNFSPYKIKLLDTDEGKNYYVSWYAAVLAAEDFLGQGESRVGRVDLFTYAKDAAGEVALVIFGAIMEIPAELQDPAIFEIFKNAVEKLSVDSTTNEIAYPHYYATKMVIDENGFEAIIGNTSIRASVRENLGERNMKKIGKKGKRTKKSSKKNKSTKSGGRSRSRECNFASQFSREFVSINSQAYKSPVDKTVTYFNKDFIDAPVMMLDSSCLDTANLDAFNPDGAIFESAHIYGSPARAITWHYEEDTDSAGTAFLTVNEKSERSAFKWDSFGSIWAERGVDISKGTAEHLLKIKNKNMFYLNWELTDEAVERLSEDLNLTGAGFKQVPIKVLEDDEERHLLTLNAYNVEFEGIGDSASGARFEFSIYVTTEDDPRPRFMVVEALSSADSYDPTRGAVAASNATFSVIDSVITARVLGDTEWQAAGFSLEFSYSFDTNNKNASSTRTWVTSTDVVYWLNGVADKVFYNSMLAGQAPVVIDSGSLSGETRWSQYLTGPNPVQALYYRESMDFVIMPWFNIQSESLQLTGEQKMNLLDVKRSTFGGLASLSSVLVSAGQQEPLVDIIVFGDYPVSPRVMLNFEVRDVEEFQRVIRLPDCYRLAKMTMVAGERPRYMLTLAIFASKLLYGGQTYYKAVWTVYIEDQCRSGRTYLHEFHVETTSGGIDVEQILKPPAETFNVTTDNKELSMHIKSHGIDVNIAVPFITSPERTRLAVADEWVFAHDKIFWGKGVFDGIFYDGSLWNARLIPVIEETDGEVRVQQETPWADFVAKTPFQAFFFESDVVFVSNPWQNIEEL